MDEEQTLGWHALNYRTAHSMHAQLMYEALEAFLATLTRGWQPIETAPKDGTGIDLWVDGERLANCRWCQKAQCWTTWDDGDWWAAGDPTHWMPKPLPPKEDA